jgi:hypothetical protein
MEGYSEEFAIFQSPALDVGIQSTNIVVYKPVGAITENSPITFRIPNNSGDYQY